MAPARWVPGADDIEARIVSCQEGFDDVSRELTNVDIFGAELMFHVEPSGGELLADDAGGVLIAEVPGEKKRVGRKDLDRLLGDMNHGVPVDVDRPSVSDIAVLRVDVDLDPVGVMGKAQVLIVG